MEMNFHDQRRKQLAQMDVERMCSLYDSQCGKVKTHKASKQEIEAMQNITYSPFKNMEKGGLSN